MIKEKVPHLPSPGGENNKIASNKNDGAARQSDLDDAEIIKDALNFLSLPHLLPTNANPTFKRLNRKSTVFQAPVDFLSFGDTSPPVPDSTEIRHTISFATTNTKVQPQNASILDFDDGFGGGPAVSLQLPILIPQMAVKSIGVSSPSSGLSSANSMHSTPSLTHSSVLSPSNLHPAVVSSFVPFSGFTPTLTNLTGVAPISINLTHTAPTTKTLPHFTSDKVDSLHEVSAVSVADLLKQIGFDAKLQETTHMIVQSSNILKTSLEGSLKLSILNVDLCQSSPLTLLIKGLQGVERGEGWMDDGLSDGGETFTCLLSALLTPRIFKYRWTPPPSPPSLIIARCRVLSHQTQVFIEIDPKLVDASILLSIDNDASNVTMKPPASHNVQQKKVLWKMQPKESKVLCQWNVTAPSSGLLLVMVKFRQTSDERISLSIQEESEIVHTISYESVRMISLTTTTTNAS